MVVVADFGLGRDLVRRELVAVSVWEGAEGGWARCSGDWERHCD